MLPVGTTVVSCPGPADVFGNEAPGCDFTVVVTDAEPPTLNGCPNGTISISSSKTPTTATWYLNAADAVDGTMPAPRCFDDATGIEVRSASTSFPTGRTYVRCEAPIDRQGNRGPECRFAVSVTDMSVPEIRGCPRQPISVLTDAGRSTSTSAAWNITVAGGPSVAPVRCNFPARFPFPVGNHTVRCDVFGATAVSCVFAVQVLDEEPPVIHYCPLSPVLAKLVSPTSTYAVAKWQQILASDNVAFSVVVTCNMTSGEKFLVTKSNLVVACGASDQAHNQAALCVFTIAMPAPVAPILTGCPAATLSVPTAPGRSVGYLTHNVEYLRAAGVRYPATCTVPTNASLRVGTYRISCVDPRDATMQSPACNFSAVVNDVEAPVVIGCPSRPITASQKQTATWDIVARDNVDGSLGRVSCYDDRDGMRLSPNGTALPDGTTYVSCVAPRDRAGNVGISCRFRILTAPADRFIALLGCPREDVRVWTDPRRSTSTGATWDVKVKDSSVSMLRPGVCTFPSGYTFGVGNHTVTCHAPFSTSVEPSVQDVSCQFSVIVVDAEPPMILNCPNDIYRVATSYAWRWKVTWPQLVATDNVDGFLTANCSVPSGTTFRADGQRQIISCGITDAAGNRASPCIFGVVVTEAQDDTIHGCPTSNLRSVTEARRADSRVTWHLTLQGAAITRNRSIICDHASGSRFPVGTTKVTCAVQKTGSVLLYTASHPCVFDVEVVDREAPLVSGCPFGYVEALTDSTKSYALDNVTWNVTAEDNVDGYLGVVTCRRDSDGTIVAPTTSAFTIGTTFVTCDAPVDSAGNVGDTCRLAVVVRSSQSPVIHACPSAPLVVPTNAGSMTSTLAQWDLSATHNGASIGIVCNYPGTGYPFAVGNHTVTCRAKAQDGASASSTVATICIFTVQVIDVEPPSFFGCPVHISRIAPPGTKALAVTWRIHVIDNSIATQHDAAMCDIRSGTEFPADGMNRTVTCVSHDVAGNRAVCRFTVVIFDKEAPTIHGCPVSGITVPVASNTNVSVPVIWNITARDNADLGLRSDLPVTCGRWKSGDVFPSGTTVVTCDPIADKNGNLAQPCTFKVHAVDTQAPTIQGCPSSEVRVSVAARARNATAPWELWAVDQGIRLPSNTVVCRRIADSTIVHPTSTVFPIGPTDVFCPGVTDSSGNVGPPCRFVVVVEDRIAPTVHGCPDRPVMVPTDPGSSVSAAATWAVTATDNSDGDIGIRCNFYSGYPFPVGNHTVTCYADRDGAQNVAPPCVFQVAVVDAERPVIHYCPRGNVTVAAGTGPMAPLWQRLVATDNVDRSITVNCTPGSAEIDRHFPSVSSVQCTALDTAGNAALPCEFVVEVIDSGQVQVMGCPSQTIKVSIPKGHAKVMATWDIRIGAASAKIGTVMSCGAHSSGQYFDVGLTTVLCGSGANICKFHVLAIDAEPPIVRGCPVDPTLTVRRKVTSLPSRSGASGKLFGSGEVGFADSWSHPGAATLGWNLTAFDYVDGVYASFLPCVVASGPVMAGDDFALVSGTAVTPSDTAFPLGVTYVQCQAPVDRSGNVGDRCRFRVTVVADSGNQSAAPNIQCPSNIVAALDLGEATSRSITWEATSHMYGALTECDYPSGFPFKVGTTKVKCGVLSGIIDKFGDSNATQGNSRDECSFTVTISDLEAPVLHYCPVAPVHVSVPVGTDPTFAASAKGQTVVIASDNVDRFVPVICHSVNTSMTTRTTVVVCIAKDNAGNSARACIFTAEWHVTESTVKVSGCPTRPIVVQSAPNSAKSASGDVTWSVLRGHDTVACDGLVSGASFHLGRTAVTCGAACVFEVVVMDTEAPVIHGCPARRVQATAVAGANESGSGNAVVFTASWALHATDNDPTYNMSFQGRVMCYVDVTGATALSGNAHFLPGITTLTCLAPSDASGNLAKPCYFDVVVPMPTTAAGRKYVVVGCPENGDIKVQTEAGRAYTRSAVWNVAVISDRRGTGTRSVLDDVQLTNMTKVPCNYASGFPFHVGIHRVRCYGDAGLVCAFNVTVVDLDPPTLYHCQRPIVHEVAPEALTAVVPWSPPIAVDAVDGYIALATTITKISDRAQFRCNDTSPLVFDLSARRQATVACVAVDAAGNEGKPCVFVVAVAQEYAVVGCPDAMTLPTVPGTGYGNALWNIYATRASPSSSRASLGDSIRYRLNCTTGTRPVIGGGHFPVGTSAVSCVVSIKTDGNVGRHGCSFAVTVTDREPPEVMGCPSLVRTAFGVSGTWNISVRDNVDGIMSPPLCEDEISGLPVVPGGIIAQVSTAVSVRPSYYLRAYNDGHLNHYTFY